MYDIIVIGAGPAGLTAALYALRANKRVLLLEMETYGGQIVNAASIKNYPGIEEISGFEFANTLYNQVKNKGGEIKFEAVNQVDKDKRVITNKNTYYGKAIIIATGVQKRKLNIEGEDKFIGRGVSYCATCDGAFFKDKKVAVVGGGNAALEDALYLSNMANKVYLIHRRDEFRGDSTLVDELKNKSNVFNILNANVVKINGDNKVESITVKQNELEKEIELDGVFIAIGQIPSCEQFRNIVDLDDNGYIISDDTMHTKSEGIYVAGDCRLKGLRQLTTAVSDGAIAATTAINEMMKL